VYTNNNSGLVISVICLYCRIYLKTQRNADITWYAAATYITVYVLFLFCSHVTMLLTMHRTIEVFITISVSCVPACVAAWKTVLRNSSFATTVRSLICSSLSYITLGGSATTSAYKQHYSESVVNLRGEIKLRELSKVSKEHTEVDGWKNRDNHKDKVQ
jgi:hypothetical protein